MSNVPPPVYVPEPMGYPRQTPVTPIVITILGIVTVCLIGMAGLASSVYTMATRILEKAG